MPPIVIHKAIRSVNEVEDPLSLGSAYVVAATNVSLRKQRIECRPKFSFRPLGLKGTLRGARVLRSGKAYGRFESEQIPARLFLCVDDQIYSTDGGVAHLVSGAKMSGRGYVCMYEAEGRLIAQSPSSDTIWWSHKEEVKTSPGLSETEEGHDTFIRSNHKNWLLNGAGLGAYVHGRIHQEAQRGIYVGDIAYKRGDADDVLLMEEQMRDAYSSPLNTSGYRGSLLALEIFPKSETTYGDGDLVGYYPDAVVSYDTHIAPRASLFDGEGKQLQEGWGQKRMVTTRLDGVSAVGPRAVTPTFTDHLFRSRFGLHSLAQTLGIGTFKDHSLNAFSFLMSESFRLLPGDDASGAAVGSWVDGQRYVSTLGYETSASDILPVSKRWASFNKATGFTADGTPVAGWEGVWDLGYNVHSFHTLSGIWGALVSDAEGAFYWATPDQGCDVSTPWCYTTRRIQMAEGSTSKISTGWIHGKWDADISVSVTTSEGETALWGSVPPGTHRLPDLDKTARWFQFQVSGKGSARIEELGVNATIDQKFTS